MDFRVAVSHYADEQNKYLPTASAFRITRAQPTANFKRGYTNANAHISDPRYDNYVYTPANLSNPDNQMMYNLVTGVNFTGPDMDERKDIKLQLAAEAANAEPDYTNTLVTNNLEQKHRWAHVHDGEDRHVLNIQYRGSRYTKDTRNMYWQRTKVKLILN